MEFVLILAWLLWLSLITNAWYVVLIPFWILGAVGLYKRSFKLPLIGLGASFVVSWIIVIGTILFVRID